MVPRLARAVLLPCLLLLLLLADGVSSTAAYRWKTATVPNGERAFAF